MSDTASATRLGQALVQVKKDFSGNVVYMFVLLHPDLRIADTFITYTGEKAHYDWSW